MNEIQINVDKIKKVYSFLEEIFIQSNIIQSQNAILVEQQEKSEKKIVPIKVEKDNTFAKQSVDLTIRIMNYYILTQQHNLFSESSQKIVSESKCRFTKSQFLENKRLLAKAEEEIKFCKDKDDLSSTYLLVKCFNKMKALNLTVKHGDYYEMNEQK